MRVLVYKTDERKCTLAKAAYLGPNDDEDANSNDNQKKDGTFRWPKQRDTDIVSHRYIFTHARVQKVTLRVLITSVKHIKKFT